MEIPKAEVTLNYKSKIRTLDKFYLHYQRSKEVQALKKKYYLCIGFREQSRRFAGKKVKARQCKT